MAELVSIFCVSERTMCLLIMPQIQHHICMGNYCYFLITSETEKATCSCIMIRNRLIIWFSHIFFMRPMRKWHRQNLRRFHFNHSKNTSFLTVYIFSVSHFLMISSEHNKSRWSIYLCLDEIIQSNTHYSLLNRIHYFFIFTPSWKT